MRFIPSAMLVVLALSAPLSARLAHAADAAEHPEVVTLHYEAPPLCPAAAVFRGRVARMTPKVTFAQDGATAADGSIESARLRIEITVEDGKYAGRALFTPRAASTPTSRTVRSRACEDVVRALALISALAIDPDAQTELANAPAPEPPEVPAENQAPSAPVAPRVTKPTKELAPPRAPSESWQSSIGGGVTIATARAPSALLGVALAFDLARGEALPRDPKSLVRLHFGIVLEGATSALTEAAGVRGRFDVLSAQLRTCPLLLPLGTLGRVVSVGPCVGVRLGGVFASGQGLDRPESRTNFWGEGTLVGRVQIRAGAAFADLAAGLAVHGTRPSYYRETPRLSVYEVPWLGFDGAFGVGVTFP